MPFQKAIKLPFEARYYKESNFAIFTSPSKTDFGWICDVDKLQQNIKQIFHVHRLLSDWSGVEIFTDESEASEIEYNTHVCEMPRNKFCINKRQTMFDYIVKQMFLPQMQTSLRKWCVPTLLHRKCERKIIKNCYKNHKNIKTIPSLPAACLHRPYLISLFTMIHKTSLSHVQLEIRDDFRALLQLRTGWRFSRDSGGSFHHPQRSITTWVHEKHFCSCQNFRALRDVNEISSSCHERLILKWRRLW